MLEDVTKNGHITVNRRLFVIYAQEYYYNQDNIKNKQLQLVFLKINKKNSINAKSSIHIAARIKSL